LGFLSAGPRAGLNFNDGFGGEKRAKTPFLSHFIYKHDLFAKTGSGQHRKTPFLAHAAKDGTRRFAKI
jgi:hypothetical protein